MTKDRLPELKQVRGLREEDTEHSPLNNDHHGAIGFLPEFFAEVQSIQDMVESIDISVDEFRRKLIAVLSAPQSDERTRQEMEDLMAHITRTANRVRGKLKTMEEDLKKDLMGQEHPVAVSAQLRIRQTQHATLMHNFVQAMTRYNEAQIEYRDKCKARIRRQLEITGRVTTDDEIEEMLETGNPHVFTQGIVVETQKAKQSLADIEARHADILKLENSIKELHSMFQDVAVIVENQGEMIDRIEQHVHSTAEYVGKGKEELGNAKEKQVKARKKKIICIVLALVIVTLIVVIIIIATRS